MPTSQPRIGWIGTGVMGAPMVRHLMDAGYPATVYNRSKSKAEALLKRGAAWGETPADVTRNSDVVFTIVGFPSDVHDTYFGEKGIVPALTAGQIVVDMTTSPPLLAEAIAQGAAEKGAQALDAPVSGGQSGAENAKLTILVGGERQTFERLLPIFEHLGKTVTYLGAAGCGQHAKMVNQILVAGHMLALAESLTYAKKCGIKPEVAVEAISHGAATSWALANLGPRVLKDDYAAGFYVDHFVKDLGIALAEAKRMKLAMPMLALAEQLYVSLQAQGHGRLGTQSIMKVYEALGAK